MTAAAWFFDNHIRVFPIWKGTKEPACRSWDDYVCSRFEAAAFTTYGVALGSLGVVDSDSAEIEAWVSASVPATPFVVTTGRGRHRYYRLLGDAPHFIHRAGFTIEFRHKGQYVIGPGSTHPSGSIYTPTDWSWKIEDIPFFPVAAFEWDDRAREARGSGGWQQVVRVDASGAETTVWAPGESEEGARERLVLPPTIAAGERHDLLFKLMRSLQARGVTDVNDLLKVLRAENQIRCTPPIADEELTRYITRVSRYGDRPGFDRPTVEEGDEWGLAGRLLDAGMSPETARVAVASVHGPAALAAEETVDLDALALDLRTPPTFFVGGVRGTSGEARGRPGSDAGRRRPARTPRAVRAFTLPEGATPVYDGGCMCFRCAHTWVPRGAPPAVCPRCKSRGWQTGRGQRSQPRLPSQPLGEGDGEFLLKENPTRVALLTPGSKTEILPSAPDGNGFLTYEEADEPACLPSSEPPVGEGGLGILTFRCVQCGHAWGAKVADGGPESCPHCTSTFWDDDSLSDETREQHLDEEDAPVEPDGPIYDEESGEIVGHSVNGVCVWLKNDHR